MTDVGEEAILGGAALLGLRARRRQFLPMREFVADVAQHGDEAQVPCPDAPDAQPHGRKPDRLALLAAGAHANVGLHRGVADRRVGHGLEIEGPVGHVNPLEQAPARQVAHADARQAIAMLGRLGEHRAGAIEMQHEILQDAGEPFEFGARRLARAAALGRMAHEPCAQGAGVGNGEAREQRRGDERGRLPRAHGGADEGGREGGQGRGADKGEAAGEGGLHGRGDKKRCGGARQTGRGERGGERETDEPGDAQAPPSRRDRRCGTRRALLRAG